MVDTLWSLTMFALWFLKNFHNAKCSCTQFKGLPICPLDLRLSGLHKKTINHWFVIHTSFHTWKSELAVFSCFQLSNRFGSSNPAVLWKKKINTEKCALYPFLVFQKQIPNYPLCCDVFVVIKLDGSTPVRYGLRLNMDEKYTGLKKQLSELCSLKPEQILLAEVHTSNIKVFTPLPWWHWVYRLRKQLRWKHLSLCGATEVDVKLKTNDLVCLHSTKTSQTVVV